MYRTAYPNELWHHGIKGQKWGIRRFQNPDGSYIGKKKNSNSDKNSNIDKDNSQNKKQIDPKKKS